MKNNTVQTQHSSWAIQEFKYASFGDRRLNSRCIQIATKLLDTPTGSIPQSQGSWSNTKGAYRFFSNGNVTDEKVLKSHIKKTYERCSKEETILVAQDTTTLSFPKRKMAGLGKIGDGRVTGCFTHSGLAMTTEGIPLGIVYQNTYTRKERPKNMSRENLGRANKKIPIEEKESYRWVECIKYVKQNLPGIKTVVVGDRESDIYDVFYQANKQNVEILIRTAWDRLVEEGELEAKNKTHLSNLISKSDVLTNYEVSIADSAGKSSRKAMMEVRKVDFVLIPPKHRKKENLPKIPLTLIDAKETNAPEGEKPLHWMLTTSLSTQTQKECLERIEWYKHRWKIERFHYVLKTGVFNVEKLQFKTLKRLSKVLAMYSVLACRIMFLMYMQRENPKRAATEFLTFEECLALKKLNGVNENKEITISEAMIYVAKLGGYLNRKKDPPPGVKALWIGFRGLSFVVMGMHLS